MKWLNYIWFVMNVTQLHLKFRRLQGITMITMNVFVRSVASLLLLLVTTMLIG
nr:MAG TPA: hypothetical protein [Bacteriophage sp.]